MEKDTVEELVSFKLKYIKKHIDLALSKWDEKDVDVFLQKAKDGSLKNAEMDAITLHQLDTDYKRLLNLLKTAHSSN